jgi:hypothetical protein
MIYWLVAHLSLEGSAVDVPLSIAITCAPFGIAYRTRIVGFLVAHGERDVAALSPTGTRASLPKMEVIGTT